MKTRTPLLFVLFTALLFAGCNDNSKESKLIGTFRARGAPTTVWTFYAKGVVTTSQPTGSLSGRYEWLDDNNLSIKFDGIGAFAGAQVFPIEKITDRGIYIIGDTTDDEPLLIRQ